MLLPPTTTPANFTGPQKLPLPRLNAVEWKSRKVVHCRVSTGKSEESSCENVLAESACTGEGEAEEEEQSLDAQILGLAIPALGVEVIDPLLSVADTAFVGRLGTAELGGLGVAATVFTACNSLFNFLANATGPLVAQAVARGDMKKAQGTTGQALVMAVLLGFGCCALLHLYGLPVLETLSGGSREKAGPVFDAAILYLSVRSWGLPAALMSTVNGGAFRGLLDTRTPLYVAIGANALNLVLNPFLIFGIGPFPHLGVEGAALTTVASEWVAAGVGIWCLSKSKLGPPSFSLPQFSEVQPLLEASFALFIRTASLQSVFLLSSSTVAHTAVGPDGSLDPIQVAAHQIIFQCWMFLAFTVDSIAVAAQGLVADSLGKADMLKAVKAADRTLQYGLFLGGLLAIGLMFARDWLPYVFSTNAEVVAAAQGVLPIVAAAQPISGLVFVFDGIFIGAADFEFVALSVMIACGIAEATMLSRGGGLSGVWQCLVMLQVGRAVGLGLRYSGTVGGPFKQARLPRM